MSSPHERILQWAKQLRSYSQVEWSRMPEIDLYMDQVITYMVKQFEPFRRNEEAKPLTPSMINNYVKDKLLKSPERKKYSRDHLAALYMICMLKQVLSIPDISDLLKMLGEEQSPDELYYSFSVEQKNALEEVAGRVSQTQERRDMLRLALELSIEANSRRVAVERILSEIARGDTEDEPEAASTP